MQKISFTDEILFFNVRNRNGFELSDSVNCTVKMAVQIGKLC